MTGKSSVYRNVSRLGVADFADHDDVGILAYKGAHRRCEGQTDGWFHLRLIDPRNLIFNGIFDGEDFPRGFIQDRQHGGERCRLARSRWACDHDQSVWQRQSTGELFLIRGRQTETIELEQTA